VTLPAGTHPPAPDEIEDSPGPVHAIDGDGTALCGGGDLEQIDHRHWYEVAAPLRCRICDALAK
jgi:hypothetical protein